MRPAALAITAALLLAGIAGQNAVLRSTEAVNAPPDITCADQGAVGPGACFPVSLDRPPGSILSYRVFPDACPDADLHVVRYVSSDSTDGKPLVAKWCA